MPTMRFARAWPLRVSQLCTWVQPDSKKAHQHRRNSTYRFLVPRGTGQLRKEQDNKNKDRDVNKGDEEDACSTRMKSMASRWSNATHEEEHDANDDDDDDEEEDEDTTHAILIVDENKGKTKNKTHREQEAERIHRRRRQQSRQDKKKTNKSNTT